MTEHNYRRGYGKKTYAKLYNTYDPKKPWGYPININKSFCKVEALSGVSQSASSGYEHSNGHRGEARAVRGAKKFVNSRHRFHEKAATRRLAKIVTQ